MALNPILANWISANITSAKEASQNALPFELSVDGQLARRSRLRHEQKKSYLAIILLGTAVGLNVAEFGDYSGPYGAVLAFWILLGVAIAAFKSGDHDYSKRYQLDQSIDTEKKEWYRTIGSNPEYRAEAETCEQNFRRLVGVNNYLVQRELMLNFKLHQKMYLVSSRTMTQYLNDDSMSHLEVLEASFKEVQRGISTSEFDWTSTHISAVNALIDHSNDEILDVLSGIMDDLIESSWYLSSNMRASTGSLHESEYSDKVVSLMKARQTQGHGIVEAPMMTLYKAVVAHMRIVDALMNPILGRPHLQAIDSRFSDNSDINKALQSLSEEVSKTYSDIQQACPDLDIEASILRRNHFG